MNYKIVALISYMLINMLSCALYNSSLPIDQSQLPEDFPFFQSHGESTLRSDIIIFPYSHPYLMIVNYLGQLVWYKTMPDYSIPKIFINKEGKRRYLLFHKARQMYGQIGLDELVVFNEDFIEIDRVLGVEYEDVYSNMPVHHNYQFIDDYHYIIITFFVSLIGNSERREDVVQEIKDGKLVFHYQTDETPELFDLSVEGGNFDYTHLNSVEIDLDGNFILSFRHIGIVKVNRQKKILWVIGKKRNDFNIAPQYLPKLQHDVKVYENGSISVWDNSGSESEYSRVLLYRLNQKSMECIEAKEYLYESIARKSISTGTAEFVDFEGEIIDINWGNNLLNGEPRFEEFDFKSKKSLFRIVFNESTNCPTIHRIQESSRYIERLKNVDYEFYDSYNGASR